ncbi:MAG: ATP-binding cassette domain-containing protein [Caldilineales bacterium]|nr:ATP-binding cassette domain-containing protein [Caldilineales bacterium]MDW8317489.1 ATP-binding cassette domain-containing protein [Anaerolineae bacterium]
MYAVEVSRLKKAFGATQAVADVSFAVEKGEIFGLLGPNGAGKTTTIRLMLDIFKPDAGDVSILGGPMTEAKKNRIGYMPEERGLYQEMPLEACLVYLATLKGLSKAEARRRLQPYLERFDLAQHRDKKVKELSKGMQQKAQIIATVLHGPELLIMDEPFSGLDPVNTQLAKDLLLELRRQGVTILMSTHIMHQVEEMCNRIVLINQGRNVLYGEVAQIQRQYSGHAVRVRLAGELPPLAGVQAVVPLNGVVQLMLDQRTTPQDILQQLVSRHCAVEQFEIALPSLDEIFIQAVSQQ